MNDYQDGDKATILKKKNDKCIICKTTEIKCTSQFVNLRTIVFVYARLSSRYKNTLTRSGVLMHV